MCLGGFFLFFVGFFHVQIFSHNLKLSLILSRGTVGLNDGLLRVMNCFKKMLKGKKAMLLIDMVFPHVG